MIFRNYSPMWVEPISTDYHGYTVCEIPPNGHGITVLMALNILSGMELPADRTSPETYHKLLEAIKLAFVDAKTYVADPRYMKTKVADLLSPAYADKRRALIGGTAIDPKAGDPSGSDTIYLCTADGQGNMVSFIQSNYKIFGSGVLIPGTGISLQDRGANFSLDENSDNCLAGGKRSYHTIIPGFLMKDGEAVGPFGVMGGFMQPQGHVQVLVNTIDYHMNPQAALDCPRVQWTGGLDVQIEAAAGQQAADALADMGHSVTVPASPIAMGRGQIDLAAGQRRTGGRNRAPVRWLRSRLVNAIDKKSPSDDRRGAFLVQLPNGEVEIPRKGHPQQVGHHQPTRRFSAAEEFCRRPQDQQPVGDQPEEGQGVPQPGEKQHRPESG